MYCESDFWILPDNSDPVSRSWFGQNWHWLIIAAWAIAVIATITVLSGCATNPKGVDTGGSPAIPGGDDAGGGVLGGGGGRKGSPDVAGTDRTKGGRVGVQWGFQPNIEILPGGGVWLVAVVFGLLAILAFIFRVQASIYAAQRNAAFDAIEVAADTKLPAQAAKKIFSKSVSGRWFGLLAKLADKYLERAGYRRRLS